MATGCLPNPLMPPDSSWNQRFSPQQYPSMAGTQRSSGLTPRNSAVMVNGPGTPMPCQCQCVPSKEPGKPMVCSCQCQQQAQVGGDSGTAQGSYHSTASSARVYITQIARYQRPAKPESCHMPILTSQPTRDFDQLAIVEGFADKNGDDNDLMPALKSKACETGADALLIVRHGPQASDSEENPGWFATLTGMGYSDPKLHPRRLGAMTSNGYYVEGIAINFMAPQEAPSAAAQ